MGALFALPTTNAIAANQQTQAFSWTLTGDPLDGIDADPRAESGMVGGSLLGPAPQGVDVVIGSNGTAAVRGQAGNFGFNAAVQGGTPQATLTSTTGPAAILQGITPLGWALIIGAAVLFLKK